MWRINLNSYNAEISKNSKNFEFRRFWKSKKKSKECKESRKRKKYLKNPNFLKRNLENTKKRFREIREYNKSQEFDEAGKNTENLKKFRSPGRFGESEESGIKKEFRKFKN